MGLVKQGARVAVIERYHNVGGGCTHWGTIPSKALRHAVSRIIEFNQTRSIATTPVSFVLLSPTSLIMPIT